MVVLSELLLISLFLSYPLYSLVLTHHLSTFLVSFLSAPTSQPVSFNNLYFTLLLTLNWVPKEWKGPPQYVDAPTGRLMMLPTDLVLIKDPSFVKWVKVYSKDQARFLKDFTKAFQKLEELGTEGLVATQWA